MSKFSESLKRFCKGRNEIGFWWTDWKATKDIQKSFRDAGLPVPEWIIEPPKPLRFNQ
jgi:hypothetical protein